MAKELTPDKARKILRDKSVKGRKLTAKQKRFFGLIAGGGRPDKRSKARRRRRGRR